MIKFLPLHNAIDQQLLSHVESIANDQTVFPEKNFLLRSQAIDDIEFQVIDRLQFLAESGDSSERRNDLKQYAEQVISQLEEVNTKMFQKLREQISLGECRGRALMNLMNEFLDGLLDSVPQHSDTGYDHSDLFLNGLLSYRELPTELKEKEPGMIYYQKTPASIIFELIKKAASQPVDVFYDLGSGLGQVSMLVNLLSSVVSKGIEYEPAYCNYAKACAADLNLSQVDFINADARYADYSSGTVFFMYTPFEGQILKDVLHVLCNEAGKRKIRIFTYGSCTTEMARQQWLRQVNEMHNCLVELAEFVSI